MAALKSNGDASGRVCKFKRLCARSAAVGQFDRWLDFKSTDRAFKRDAIAPGNARFLFFRSAGIATAVPRSERRHFVELPDVDPTFERTAIAVQVCQSMSR
jgi:hypothetical protein